MGKRKFNPGDRVVVNQKAPGDYRDRQATIVEHGPNISEYAVNLDGEIVYLNSWWLAPVHEEPEKHH